MSKRLQRRAELVAAGRIRDVHNASTYKNWDCRCEACRAGNREASRKYLQKRNAHRMRPPEDLVCLLHLTVDCVCVDSQPSAKNVGKPFEATLWQCANGHQEIGSRRATHRYGYSCMRCRTPLLMIRRAIIIPP